jgi:hypothetical protein
VDGKTVPVKILDDDREERRRCREIEKTVAGAATLRIHFTQPLRKLLIPFRFLEVCRDVMQHRHELVPEFLAKCQHVRRALDAFLHLTTKTGIRQLHQGEANDCKAGRQQLLTRQVVQRRHQLSAREVATGAEDDEGTAFLRLLQKRTRARRALQFAGESPG